MCGGEEVAGGRGWDHVTGGAARGGGVSAVLGPGNIGGRGGAKGGVQVQVARSPPRVAKGPRQAGFPC